MLTGQLQKALSVDDLGKYDDRVGEESLQLADMGENLVRCPYCNYAALMAADDKVFMCQAADCKKVIFTMDISSARANNYLTLQLISRFFVTEIMPCHFLSL